MDKLQSDLQSADERLREKMGTHPMSGLACMRCGRVHSDTAQRCHFCNEASLQRRYCNINYRVSEYFAVLRGCELWPSITPFTTCALSDIALRFQCAETDHKHQCLANTDCPLRQELKFLSGRAQSITMNMAGLSLEKEGDDEGKEQPRTVKGTQHT